MVLKEEQVHGEVSRGQHVNVCGQRNDQELTLHLTTGQEVQQITVQDGKYARKHIHEYTNTVFA